MSLRTIVAIIEVDDDKAIEEYLGTIDYLEREFGWLQGSGIHLENARVLDIDDKHDAQAIYAIDNIIFK